MQIAAHSEMAACIHCSLQYSLSGLRVIFQKLLDLLFFGISQAELGSDEKILNLLRASRTDNGPGHSGIVQRPGNGNHASSNVMHKTNIVQHTSQFQIT